MRRENSKRKQKRAMADNNRRLSKQNKSRGADATWEGAARNIPYGVSQASLSLSLQAGAAARRCPGPGARGREWAAD